MCMCCTPVLEVASRRPRFRRPLTKLPAEHVLGAGPLLSPVRLRGTQLDRLRDPVPEVLENCLKRKLFASC